MHGKSLRSVLGGSNKNWRDYLVAEFHFHGRRPFYPRRSIRDVRYKLIHNLRAGKGVLPGNGIDGDPAYRLSQQPAYNGTVTQTAFRTFANPPEFELYDLANDLIEFHNLAGNQEFTNIEQRLKAALLEYRHETDDPFLEDGMIEKMILHSGVKTQR